MSMLATIKKSLVLAVLSAVVFTATPTDAMAQARPTPVKHTSTPAAGKVGLELKVVHATNSGQVDPQLRGVMDNFKFTRFNGFKLLDTQNAKLGPGQDATFALAGGRKIKVTLVSRDARAAKVRVVMTNAQGKLLDTTVSIHRNRAFFIAGPDYDGGKLVLPVSVRY
jgi:hypothetical protein